jgi:hypothetical protein
VRRLVLVAALVALPMRAEAQTIGTVAATRNILRARVERGGAARALPTGATLRAGDVVSGGRGGLLQLALRDGSVMTVGDAAATLTAGGADVARGALRLAVADGRTAALATPAAQVAVGGGTVELLVGAPAAAALARDPALRAGLSCAARTDCVDAASATLLVLRGPGPARTDRRAAGAVRIAAGGRTLDLQRAGVVAIGAAGQVPSAPLPLRQPLAEQLDAALSTRPTPQEQRGVADEIAAALSAAAALPRAGIAPAAGRIVMDYRDDPFSTQTALARVAARLPAAAPLLTRLSLAVLAASDVAPVGILADALSGTQGATLAAQLPPGERMLLEDAVIRLAGAPAPER